MFADDRSNYMHTRGNTLPFVNMQHKSVCYNQRQSCCSAARLETIIYFK